jgi:hypothetical protein
MQKKKTPSKRTRLPPPDEALFATARRRTVPFDFVLTELEALGPVTRPMFSCVAVYLDDKIVFAVRDRPHHTDDNGVWLATSREHHASLRVELPSLRSIGVLAGGAETGWQILPANAATFEEEVLHACELVRRSDPRIGKTPKPRKPRPPSAAAEATRKKPKAPRTPKKASATKKRERSAKSMR